ncbi:hypothetical protein DERP_015029 [Dermatophagoides pteronyssinus]|uniref:Uncharacterized protein n=1 Tax=Dermatophagoides pteronyssinus TaxID=6956 RepID=A0ABQ8JCV0_DERPT|nr:hypothetical protein DERP_015029 [Dermatophagoides pteronyssinus]
MTKLEHLEEVKVVTRFPCPLSQMDRLAIVDIDEVIESSEIVSWFSCWATWMKTMGEFLNLGAGPNHVNFVGDSP